MYVIIFCPISTPEINNTYCNYNYPNDIALVENISKLLTNIAKKCKYYDNIKFSTNNEKNNKNDNLCIIHFNIRSLRKHFDAFQEFLFLQTNLPDIFQKPE